MNLSKEYRSARRNLVLVSAILLAQQSAGITPKTINLLGTQIDVRHQSAIPYALAVFAVYVTYLLTFEWKHLSREKRSVLEKLDYRGTAWFGLFAIQFFCVKEIRTSITVKYAWALAAATVAFGFVLRLRLSSTLRKGGKLELKWTNPWVIIVLLIAITLPTFVGLHFYLEEVGIFQFFAALLLSLVSFSQAPGLPRNLVPREIATSVPAAEPPTESPATGTAAGG